MRNRELSKAGPRIQQQAVEKFLFTYQHLKQRFDASNAGHTKKNTDHPISVHSFK